MKLKEKISAKTDQHDNQIITKSPAKILYGFQEKTFYDILHTKAKKDYPNMSETEVMDIGVAKVQQKLFDQMDIGNQIVRKYKMLFFAIIY